MKAKIGFNDRNGEPLFSGDKVYIFDKSGKYWNGTIIPVPHEKILESALVKEGRIQYGFQSSNLLTWINNQEYASELIKE